MESVTQQASASKKMLWAGRVVSALAVLALLFSGVLKVLKLDDVVKEFGRLGYESDVILGIGIVEIACALLYAFPRTAMLGAVLLTGYLGGATATHVRIGDSYYSPIIVGVLVWLGLFLREPRLRVLLPLRKP